ncbi:hypothetical protein V3C99_013567, partial [Haemonchus contortus]
MGRLGREGRCSLHTSSPLCRWHRAYNTEHRAGGTNAGQIRQLLWKDLLETEHTKTMLTRNGQVS